jgi:hypothetical protein
MKNKDLYQEWIARCRQPAIPEDFPQRVMAALPTRRPLSEMGLAVRLQGLILGPARWAAAIFFLLLGLFRLSFVAFCIMVP